MPRAKGQPNSITLELDAAVQRTGETRSVFLALALVGANAQEAMRVRVYAAKILSGAAVAEILATAATAGPPALSPLPLRQSSGVDLLA